MMKKKVTCVGCFKADIEIEHKVGAIGTCTKCGAKMKVKTVTEAGGGSYQFLG